MIEIDINATGWNTNIMGEFIGNFKGELIADGKIIQPQILKANKGLYLIDGSLHVNFYGEAIFNNINVGSYKNVSLKFSGNWVVHDSSGLGSWVPTKIGTMLTIPINHSYTYKIK